ncbi:DUF6894 family protein [Phenylobacterium sp.]|jgi:hypothetical protein|uniref:DUF6894 family protein n=1 Tax=Phenylobacterium sp. TaxID=1871053 RepID=UPI002E2FD0AF|nr:hypothetical protein [Phenylobacterium sp.]HEX2560808.1 hypothetical protein [Phenylobacterium sp.]
MPQYFFHIGDSRAGLDPIGIDLEDHNAARIQAAQTLGDMLKDRAGEFWTEGEMRLTVTDDTGLILFVLDLSAIEAPVIANRRSRPAGA